MAATQTPNSKNLRRIALGIQYDGTPFCGWQSQRDQDTIQDQVEAAIGKFVAQISGHQIRITAAGRTDTGVHALGQVAHFDTIIDRPDWSWVRGLNSFLPESISIQWAKEVPFEFDARFSAYERSYAYFLINSPVKTALLQNKAGFNMLPPGRQLLVEEMRLAAQYLMGEHDFTSFRSSECQSKSPLKTIHQLDIVEESAKLFFFVRANAFLHHMVRNLVGALLLVGLGKQPKEWIKEVLEKKDRSFAAPTFSADGLYLAQVGYPEHFQIPLPRFSDSAIPEYFLNTAFRQNTLERALG
jgi:tRNA pseudouridine38-40 synthase